MNLIYHQIDLLANTVAYEQIIMSTIIRTTTPIAIIAIAVYMFFKKVIYTDIIFFGKWQLFKSILNTLWIRLYVKIKEYLLSFYNYCFFTGTQLGLAGAGGVLVTTTNPIITMVLMWARQAMSPIRRPGLAKQLT